ncbi:glutamate--cysteine ligase, partial [Streptomyces sp. NPDC031705]
RSLDELWSSALPALGPDDLTTVRAARQRLAGQGNGADRQRAAYRRLHSHLDVVDHLVRQTTS